MKFSKLLDEYQLAEWKGSKPHFYAIYVASLRTYIPYYFLKKPFGSHRPSLSLRRLGEIAAGRLQEALRELQAQVEALPELAREAWLAALQREVRRVDSNVKHGLQARHLWPRA